jgi:hypothetical protein
MLLRPDAGVIFGMDDCRVVRGKWFTGKWEFAKTPTA